MLVALALILLIIFIFGPQVWSKHVLKRYSTPIEELAGTGGQLASHLLNKLDMSVVKVEECEENADHYDPEKRKVRLGPDHYSGKSLTAIVVAAHEVGHAIQHKTNYRPFFLRWRLAKFTWYTEKIASFILVVFPFAAILTRMPLFSITLLLAGICIMLLPVLVHLITLPVEWDASFGKALPILIKGEYIPESAIPMARKILTAAALTYLAASLASLLNFYRWIAILRR
jgi:Zn-dependent membrane protease YugP